MSFAVIKQGSDEAELGVSVSGSPVGVAAELAVVGQPRVGALDDPAQPEPERLLGRPESPGLVRR